jgi:guanylate kinase
MPKGTLLVISGPSGSGKGTLCEKLLELEKNVRFSVSATTREPRQGEVHGVHYFFISEDEFSRMIENNEFLEYADVFGMNKYGTPKAYVEQLLNEGRDVVLDIDVQGAMNVKQIKKDAVMIFVVPPSPEVLEQRLRHRNTETDEQISRRLHTAKAEVAMAGLYDYIIVNEDIETAVDEIRSILKATKCKMVNRIDWLTNQWGGSRK